MNTINLTSTHYFGFLYLAFAHQTDGIYSREEQISIWKLVVKWSEVELSRIEHAKIMDEVMLLYKSNILNTDFEEYIFDIARIINEYSWFCNSKKIESLKDLKTIALSDKKYLKSEKNWIKKIAEIWNIDKKKIQNILK
ncbi:MAG: hypothetical protein JXR51_12760 [Bacteroidales bacterium]|nr:hypothetical protein [Bacteroidales bacterium]MBN2758041.1 hypothetical protein [Bacteroidales bacterium]